MIKLISTESEYRISLPFDQRNRAKRIAGYRWDPSLKLWCFPKTAASRGSIFSEFGPEELEDPTEDMLEELLDARKGQISAMERTIETNNILIDLFNVAEKFGLPDDSDIDGLVAFTKASYAGNKNHADLAAKLATNEARLSSALEELARSKTIREDQSDEIFTHILAQKVWSSQNPPTVVKEFTFDARGVIDLQNYLVKMLSHRLGRVGERVAFADLIREAEEGSILSGPAARTCHSLRIQRNHFAHESVEIGEVFPRAMLCLCSFSVVYHDILRNQGAL